MIAVSTSLSSFIAMYLRDDVVMMIWRGMLQHFGLINLLPSHVVRSTAGKFYQLIA
jgi:hypothetical protein